MKNKIVSAAITLVALAGASFQPIISSAAVSVPPVTNLTATASGSSITLSWKTPTMSDLSEFYVYSSKTVLTETNDSFGIPVSNLPHPTSGAEQSVTVSGLSSGTYYFSVRAVHLSGTASPAAFASATILGGGGGPSCLQPNPVGNIVVSLGETTGSLTWLTVGGTTLSEIELRQSESPLSDSNFDIAPQVSGVPQPLANQTQSVSLSGLKSNTTYYFGFRVYNLCGVASALATASGSTTGGGSTSTPPINPPPGVIYPTGGGGGAQIVDVPAAINTSLFINNGAATTSDPIVKLSISAPGAAEMMISDNDAFVGRAWEPFNANASWVLPGNFGTKKIFMRFRADNLVFSDASDSIEYVAAPIVPIIPVIIPPAPLAGLSLSTDPSELTVIDGDQVTVVVSANPELGVPSYARMNLRYPEDVLELASIDYGTGWVPSFAETDNISDEGTLVKTARYPGGITATTTFAILTFNSKTTATGTVALVDAQLEAYDETGVAVLNSEVEEPSYLFASLVSPANGHERNLRAFGITIGIFLMIYAISLLARIGHRKFKA